MKAKESDKGETMNWKDEQRRPCKHIGCYNHISHPCEGCGRIQGRIPKQFDITKLEEICGEEYIDAVTELIEFLLKEQRENDLKRLIIKEKGSWGTIHYKFRWQVGDYKKQLTFDSEEQALNYLITFLNASEPSEVKESESVINKQEFIKLNVGDEIELLNEKGKPEKVTVIELIPHDCVLHIYYKFSNGQVCRLDYITRTRNT